MTESRQGTASSAIGKSSLEAEPVAARLNSERGTVSVPRELKGSGPPSLMRVAMIVHAYYLKDARVRRYAELLAGEGHRVDVLCLRESDEPRTAHHLGVNIYRIDLGRARGGRLSYVLEYALAALKFFFLLNRLWLGGQRYDVLHIHNFPNFLVYCALVQRLAGIRVILDVHDPMPELFQSKYQLPHGHWLPRLLRLEEWLSARFATAVIAANHAFAAILEQRSVPATKVTVVMNAPNNAFLISDECRRAARSGKPAGDFHVIYVGTIAPRYGIEFAVRAVAQLHAARKIPGLRFTIIPKIANEGQYLDHVLSEIARLKLGDIFTVMAPVAHDDMPGVFASADALLYTPKPDVHMDIALSLKIPEAVAVGCPVVASRLAVNERYFGNDSIYMFESGNVEECALRLYEVYADEDERAKRVAKAQECLAEISWTRQSRSYVELLDRIRSASRVA